MKRVCVLGLGYIGLPTACVFATHGYQVIGVDTNIQKVQMINQGHLPTLEPGLNSLLKAAVDSSCLIINMEPEPADVFIIAVPTPVTSEKKVDLSFIREAAKSVVPVLRKGNLVVLESTSPPCTTRDFLSPLLEESGLKAGEDFFVAYCPERVIPGHLLTELISNNRIIGGINSRSGMEAENLYRSFVKGDIYLTDSITAEMVKLVENTFRDVNIALANELAIICESLSISVWDVIQLANHHPRVNVHLPGPGVGGHCIPVDPWFIVEQFPIESKIISLGRRINDNMPKYIYSKIVHIMEAIEDPQITIMGLSYKANMMISGKAQL
ncbi:MAG: nucleotide sugar dehydrogenase [Desulfotomaculaceae bacterium]|nr:nucleotide sugar dehydrogenase [Desulfotomaculaceae bacterium]